LQIIYAMLRLMFKKISIVLIAFLFTQCGQQPLFEENTPIPREGWYVNKPLVFKFKVTDTQKGYNIAYNLRNTLKYPYSNLYVTYYLEDSKGKVIATELNNIALFDAKRGKPFGSGLGDTFVHQLSIPALQQYKFPKADTYTFRIVQYMRQDPLLGLLNVGVRIMQEN